ncbi:MAG: hypothetical protein ACRDJO_03485 [Actinomycetota bacterium]
MQPADTSGFPLLRAVATILLWLIALGLLLATLAVAGFWVVFGDNVQRPATWASPTVSGSSRKRCSSPIPSASG